MPIKLNHKASIILIGTVAIFCTIALFILKSTIESGAERRIGEEIYKKTVEEINKQVAREQEIQLKLDQLIKEYEKATRESEIRDSLLRIKQDVSIYKLKKIESEYEKINDRYYNVTKDSLRRLFTN